MNFSDIFKSSFLDNLTSVSMFDIVLAMLLSFAIGLFIFFIYKKTYSGVMFSAGFGTSLIAMTMISTFVILAVTSNVVLSLGMVGALSIVRFRTAVKEPLDIAYLFWAIAAGIVLAAGMIPLAVFGSILIGIILLVFSNRKSNTNPYILIVSCSDALAEKNVMEYLKEHSKKTVIKSKSVAKGAIELNVEVRIKDEDTHFVNDIAGMKDVNSAVLVSYNGDYMG